MHNTDLIMTLAVGLAAALGLGYLTHRLGLSPIVGYLLAGIAVGPFTPGIMVDRQIAVQLSDVGVILLMFGVGLQFHLKELLAVRRVALPGAIVQSLCATALAAWIGHSFGWSWSNGIVFGICLSVASTVVLIRVLSDNRDLHTPAGHIAVGWLVVEDLFTVFVLVLLPVVFGNSEDSASIPAAVGATALKVSALVAFVFLVGGRAVPWLLDRVAATRSRELFTLTVLVTALGIAVGSTKVFGVSMELGAFLAGMVVGRSEFSLRAATEALPMRDAFAVLFFVSVGMLLDPAGLRASPGLLGATLGVILVGKPAAALAIVLMLRYPLRIGLSVAVALAQIGEFSFLLGKVGVEQNLIEPETYNVLVAAAILSITVNPLLYRTVRPIDAWIARRPRLGRWFNTRAPELAPAKADAQEVKAAGGRHRAVVLGYGPVGRTVCRLLRENGIEPTVIELNMETVRRLKREGIPAVYGDASHRDTLVGAGVKSAGSLILSASGVTGSEETIRLARELNPKIRVLARATYVKELSALRNAGADAVFSGEGETALALTEALLRGLGATPEQIDRERERVHAELLGGPRAMPMDDSVGASVGEDEPSARESAQDGDAGDRRPAPAEQDSARTGST